MRHFRGFEFYKIIIHQNQTSVKIVLQKVAKFRTLQFRTLQLFSKQIA